MDWKTIYQLVYKVKSRWVFMFKYCFLSTVIILITACSNDGIYFENSYLIENISIIHPIEEVENQMTLVISENKIINQFKTNQVKVSQKNVIYDGYEKYIMPGLWDAHIHFAYETDLANAMPDLFLAHGVTSLRDTGGEIDFVNSFKQKSLENPKTTPRVKIAGPLVDGNYNVYDGSSPNYPELSIRTANVIDLKKQVQILIDKNVDFLKAYEMLSPAQFEAIAEIAKENNLKLTGHVPLSMSVIDASNLGLNSIEHLRNIELSMSTHSERFLKERKEILENKKQIKGSQLRRTLHKKQRFKSIYSLDSSKIKEVVSVLAKNKTWQIPTLRLYKNYVYQKYKDSSYTSYFKMLPKNKKEEWISEIKEIPRNLNVDLKNYSDWTQIMVKYMNLNGIKFMAGTDVPIGYLLPGLSLHQELIELNNSGLSRREVIQSATINPAKYFNMNDSLGKVKTGYIADLVILNKNPLENIENTLSINAVIKDGKYLGRKYLDSLLYHNKDDQYFRKLIGE